MRVRARDEGEGRGCGLGADWVAETDGVFEVAVDQPSARGGEELVEHVSRRQALVRG